MKNKNLIIAGVIAATGLMSMGAMADSCSTVPDTGFKTDTWGQILIKGQNPVVWGASNQPLSTSQSNVDLNDVCDDDVNEQNVPTDFLTTASVPTATQYVIKSTEEDGLLANSCEGAGCVTQYDNTMKTGDVNVKMDIDRYPDFQSTGMDLKYTMSGMNTQVEIVSSPEGLTCSMIMPNGKIIGKTMTMNPSNTDFTINCKDDA